MSQRAYYSSLGVDCKNLLWEIAIVKNIYYHVKKLRLNHSCYPYWEPGPWISSIIPSVTLIPAFANSCCRSWNEFYFPDRSGQVNQFTAIMKNSCVQWVAKELAIVLPYLSDSDLQYNLRQGWRHAFNGYCDHCSWKKLNNWLQCRSSLRCCNQSVHVYQNCLEQSQKHVCDGAYDHYNYMETRLFKLKLSSFVSSPCLFELRQLSM